MSRKIIGLFIDWIETPYHVSLISGINQAAEQQGHSLLVFVGGCINSPVEWEAPRNLIYRLGGPETLDGLILSAGSAAKYCKADEFYAFCSNYGSLPLVSIGERVKHFPSVLLDNKTGLKDLLFHLIDVHCYRNIGFIKGPEDTIDAMERYEIYCSVLEERGIPFDPRKVVEGIFEIESGVQGVEELLDQRQQKLDVIVAGDDDMAVGAIVALQKRGLDVPGDVAVVGFDNQEFYKYMRPSLTTVRQPTFEMGRRAVELLDMLMKGLEVPAVSFMPSAMLLRESCGCRHSVTGPEIVEAPGNRDDLPGKIYAELKKLLKLNFYEHKVTISPGDGERLVSAFFKSLEEEDLEPFTLTLRAFLERQNRFATDDSFWQSAFSILRTYLLGFFPVMRNASRPGSTWTGPGFLSVNSPSAPTITWKLSRNGKPGSSGPSVSTWSCPGTSENFWISWGRISWASGLTAFSFLFMKIWRGRTSGIPIPV